MENNIKPTLDTLDITDRLRNYRKRSIMSVKPRTQPDHLRKRVGMDVWEFTGQYEQPAKSTKVSQAVESFDQATKPRADVKPRQKTVKKTEKNNTQKHDLDIKQSTQEEFKKLDLKDFEASAKNYKQSKRRGIGKLKLGKQPMFNYVLYGMAAFVFIVGILAAIRSFSVDHKIAQTVSAQSNNTPQGDVDENKPSDSDVRNYSVAPDMPKTVSIPKLSIFARVKSLTIKGDGSLNAPSNIHDAGWYNQSAKPGSPGGASLFDGHVSGPTQKGVFYKIETLKQGDIVTVERGDGSKLEYSVVKVDVTKAADVDMSKMMLPITVGKHGLNLITCTGKFDPKSKTYESRALVYTQFVRVL